MILAAAFLALSLAPLQGGLTVEGKPVNLSWPAAPAVAPPSPDLVGWRGWTYLGGTPGKVESKFLAGYDWSQVQSAYDAAKGAASPVLWHARFVVLERTESDFRDASGVLRFDR